MSIIKLCLKYFLDDSSSQNLTTTLKGDYGFVLPNYKFLEIEKFLEENLSFNIVLTSIVCSLIGGFIYWLFFIPYTWKKVSFLFFKY